MTKKTAVSDRLPTLKDVAKLANVSVMTVSNVVNRRNGFVSELTRRNVEKIIQKVGYRPSATSRRLRSTEKYSVGMLIVDDSLAFLSDPFITEIVAGLSNHLSSNKYSLNIQGIQPHNFAVDSIFTNIGTDAICTILCGSPESRRKIVTELLTLRQPLIIFQETLEFKHKDVAVISQDDFDGGFDIASHVLSQGARKLLLLQVTKVSPLSMTSLKLKCR